MTSIAVVIPCYRVHDRILAVLSGIGRECSAIYVVDDGCPEGTGDLVESACRDDRVRVLRHAANEGVGAATMTGYRTALSEGAEIVVKCDGDGQMDPARIPQLVAPIVAGRADYTKGNRFYDLSSLHSMPRLRLFGNSVLSFASKLSSGYWNLFDPTNGFTAIHADVLRHLPVDRVDRRWLFESDVLYHLGIMRAVVEDVPMPACYGGEKSSLSIGAVIPRFIARHAANTGRRIFYSYYLRDFNIASVELALGVVLASTGLWLGITRWIQVERTQVLASSGTVMLAALPLIIGVQLLLSFLGYDLQNVPRVAVHTRLAALPER